MTTNPMITAARHTRRERRFDPDVACVRCGITTPETLVPVTRRFLEAHHVCGQAHDDALTVPVCRNCHAVLTEGQHAAGVPFQPPPTILHQLAAALASELDATLPTWREMPSAKALGVGS